LSTTGVQRRSIINFLYRRKMDPLPISTSVFYKKRYINLESAIDDLDDDEGPADLVIIPPSPGYQTDNDDIDDDNIQDNVLPPRTASYKTTSWLESCARTFGSS
jgi:hypothetical protein